MNAVNLMGRLTADPELKYTAGQNPIAIASFTMAISRGKDLTDFINLTAFGKLAETIEKYCRKGDCIGITGRLQQNRWEDKEGKKKSRLDVVAENLTFGPKVRTEAKEEPEFEDVGEELPFKF